MIDVNMYIEIDRRKGGATISFLEHLKDKDIIDWIDGATSADINLATKIYNLGADYGDPQELLLEMNGPYSSDKRDRAEFLSMLDPYFDSMKEAFEFAKANNYNIVNEFEYYSSGC